MKKNPFSIEKKSCAQILAIESEFVCLIWEKPASPDFSHDRRLCPDLYNYVEVGTSETKELGWLV